ncbi:MAG: F0F1 ATP synthase subunit A [Bacteroidia bacterium]|nr:F0F1 ATP synthase subunit A [Bacteroidia bacterium]
MAQHDAHPQQDHDTHTPDAVHQDDGAHSPADTAAHAAGAHETHHEPEAYNASASILHHILDTHDWEITEIPAGKDAAGKQLYRPISIPLPWFFYSSRDGFQVVGSTAALPEKGYVAVHDQLYALKAGATVHADAHGAVHLSEEELATIKDADVTLVDLSITRTSFQMLLIGILLVILFTGVARAYARRGSAAPKGFQSFMEPIILFIRDEVARPYLHNKADAFLPYLLTLFFFIWFCNILGLTPLNSNITGNISVTAALAILTFILTQVNASKDHWIHIFNTPGVPWWLKFGIPLMPVVEFIGLFTKPFALAIRLFANITAGHFMVLGLVSLIFIMGKNGESLIGGLAIAPLSVLFTLVIFCLETIVAIIQPFIFTLLTAVFIGMAMESHDHSHDHGHDHASDKHHH